MKDAVTKATTDHKQFEHQLKMHRKSFGDSLGDLEERVAAFEMYDVIARRAEHAREVCLRGLYCVSNAHACLYDVTLEFDVHACTGMPMLMDVCGARYWI